MSTSAAPRWRPELDARPSRRSCRTTTPPSRRPGWPTAHIAMVFNDSSAADATEPPPLALRRHRRRGGRGAGRARPSRRSAFWGAPRAPMTLAISDDGGRTWPHRRNLEAGDGYCMTNNSKRPAEPRVLLPLASAQTAGRRAARRLHLLAPGHQIRPRQRGLGARARPGERRPAPARRLLRRADAARPRTSPPDHARFVAHCRRLLDEGCDGIALLGTTGEANSFSTGERQALLEAAVAAGIAPDRLLPGTGVAALTETVALTSHALSLGVTTVVMLPPFYYKGVSDDGVFAAYAEVIERIGGPAAARCPLPHPADFRRAHHLPGDRAPARALPRHLHRDQGLRRRPRATWRRWWSASPASRCWPAPTR